MTAEFSASLAAFVRVVLTVSFLVRRFGFLQLFLQVFHLNGKLLDFTLIYTSSSVSVALEEPAAFEDVLAHISVVEGVIRKFLMDHSV